MIRWRGRRKDWNAIILLLHGMLLSLGYCCLIMCNSFQNLWHL